MDLLMTWIDESREAARARCLRGIDYCLVQIRRAGAITLRIEVERRQLGLRIHRVRRAVQRFGQHAVPRHGTAQSFGEAQQAYRVSRQDSAAFGAN